VGERTAGRQKRARFDHEKGSRDGARGGKTCWYGIKWEFLSHLRRFGRVGFFSEDLQRRRTRRGQTSKIAKKGEGQAMKESGVLGYDTRTKRRLHGQTVRELGLTRLCDPVWSEVHTKMNFQSANEESVSELMGTGVDALAIHWECLVWRKKVAPRHFFTTVKQIAPLKVPVARGLGPTLTRQGGPRLGDLRGVHASWA